MDSNPSPTAIKNNCLSLEIAELEHAVGNFILRVACNRTFTGTLPTIQREPTVHSRGLTNRCLSAPGEEPLKAFSEAYGPLLRDCMMKRHMFVEIKLRKDCMCRVGCVVGQDEK